MAWSADGGPGTPSPGAESVWVTEVELGMSCCWPGGSNGQGGLGETAVYEVAAVLDVSQAAPDGPDDVFRGAEGDVRESSAP